MTQEQASQKINQILEAVQQISNKQIELDSKVNKLYGVFTKIDNIQRWLEPTNHLAATIHDQVTNIQGKLNQAQPAVNLTPQGLPSNPPPTPTVTAEEVATIQHDSGEDELAEGDEDEEPSNRIDVCMAVQEGRYIPQQVIKSLNSQSIPIKLWVTTQDQGNHAAGARNQVKRYAKSKYVLMMDNDIYLEPNTLPRLVDFLDKNDHFAAIGISKYCVPKGHGEALVRDHIDAAPVLWRNEYLKNIQFEYRQELDTNTGQMVHVCECKGACQDIRNQGKEIGWLTGIKCHHIANTKWAA